MPKKLYAVRLNPRQIKALNKLAKAEDIPAAQIIRKAIDAYLAKQK
jgi:predicted DNA-binding protein